MAQAFETTYERYYRKQEINRRQLLKPVDRFADILPESGNWLIIKSLEEQKKSGKPLTEVENAVKAMYRKRLYSTYQLDYCSKEIPKEAFIQETCDNELLRWADELYSRKQDPVLPTRSSARRVFGYLRPDYTYTPLTMYQLVHGGTAYKLLKEGLPKEVTFEKMEVKPNPGEKTKDALKSVEKEESGHPVMREAPGHHKLITQRNLKRKCSCPNVKSKNASKRSVWF